MNRGAASGLIATLLIIWFVIGAIAAGQRHYFSSGTTANCGTVGTITVTILAGPLNYAGVNPKVTSCKAPQPSQ